MLKKYETDHKERIKNRIDGTNLTNEQPTNTKAVILAMLKYNFSIIAKPSPTNEIMHRRLKADSIKYSSIDGIKS